MNAKLRRVLSKIKARLFWGAAFLEFLVQDRPDKTVLIFGEKAGTEARDNAFSMFSYLHDQGRRDVYYISGRQQRDKDSLAAYRGHVVKRASFRHYRLALRARMLMANDGWQDVYPSDSRFLDQLDTPFFYLSHGIRRFKRSYFSAGHYKGRLSRINLCLTSEIDIARNEMIPARMVKQATELDAIRQLCDLPRSTLGKEGLEDFSRRVSALVEDKRFDGPAAAVMREKIDQARQIISRTGFPLPRIVQTGLPRHDRLAALTKDAEGAARPYVGIFFTWREYWPEEISAQEALFSTMIRTVIEAPGLRQVLLARNLKARIYLHSKLIAFSPVLEELTDDIFESAVDVPDLQAEMVRSVALITDYSSVSFDFMLGGAKVVFYQPDKEQYDQNRGDYIDPRIGRDWIGPVVTDVGKLAATLDDTLAAPDFHRAALLEDYANFGRSRALLARALSAQPPRVTFVCYNIFGIGGTVMSVTNAANHLFDQGYQVEILSLRRTARDPILGLNPAIRVHSLVDSQPRKRHRRAMSERVLDRLPSLVFHRNEDLYHRTSLLTDLRLMLKLRSITADVLIPTIPSLVRACLWFSRRRSAVLIQEHKFLEAHAAPIQAMIRKHYHKADGIMVLTQADAREYKNVTGHDPFQIPNGVRRTDAALSRQPARPRVIALGRLDPQKQYDLLFRAFAQVAEELGDWELHLFGEGSEHARLTQLIGELGMTGRIHMRGKTSNALEELGRSEICAVSSTFEGFGMTFIEAYSLRKPVVTFDIERGPKEIVLHGVTGLKASPFDVDDYAAQLGTLMSSPEMRARMGQAGYELFERAFCMTTVGPRLEKALAAVHARSMA